MERTYLCIDLKSFYASVECVERGLDPMKARLVVADPNRSEKTICLAVSPALKAMGVPGRCRVFEIPDGIQYEMAEPRMQLYIDYSAEVYGIYLKYIAKEDIHVYSIDEAFIDVTDYLPMYGMTAKELGKLLMQDVLEQIGIPSACGIGTNLYLAKVALDITAKHAEDRIGILDEVLYRKTLWDHRPITDFWRIGKGIAARLEAAGIRTMQEVAEADENLLYKLFGIDAELLIDHAWGRETVEIRDIKAYRPKENSISGGQVLPRDYEFGEGKMIAREMADLLSLELVEKGCLTDSVTLHVGYSNRLNKGPAHGTVHLTTASNSARRIIACTGQLYDRIVDPFTPIRRMTLTFNHVTDEAFRQYDLFTDPLAMEKERSLMKAMLDIKEKYGKNAVLRGMDLQKGATTIERNQQIGGHKSGTA
ncbi:DNA repair protein [Sellimonas caecigallum]|uniref:DNA repair protein n=1 Tax=Sellimonas caecigallum TaxID=2592333 RepID=A0ABS7L395_9FIRM|nr:DNA repair protein [Sellimonas caecigallum]MBY0757515.1 DNA repair protein [Sellimonas caecigallum]